MVMVRVRGRVRVMVSYIMRIWRWEEFSRCDKFSTTPACLAGIKVGMFVLGSMKQCVSLCDPICQVMLHSSEVGSHEELCTHL